MTNMLLFANVALWLKPFGYVICCTLGLSLVLWLLWNAAKAATPRLAAIAGTTAKEAVQQPFFLVIVGLGTLLLLFFPFLPYNTFGEDVKMLKDTGLTLVMILGIGLALWTASVSVADEIEGRTALTVLSKPVSRRTFILGKFSGIVLSVAILFLILGTIYLGTVGFKVVYDARENALPDPTSHVVWEEIVKTAPGLLLAFLEAVVLASISVAVSTRLAMLPNLMICATVYVLGNLMPLVLSSSASRFEIVAFAARFMANILPVLENFDMKTPIATGQVVPLAYLPWAMLYCALYCSVSMLLALLLFEDRDLA